MLRQHDAGRALRSPLDWLAGKVVDLGRASNILTPANAAVDAALKLDPALGIRNQ